MTNQLTLVDKGIPFIRCIDIKGGNIDLSNVQQIDAASNTLLWKSEVKPRMVLITMSGTVGNIAVAQEDWSYPMNSNQDIAKITTSEINPYYLATYLKSRSGALQMMRLQAGAIQQHLYLSQIEKLRIPTLGNDFQKRIEDVNNQANQTFNQSQSLYTQSETLLLKALHLQDWQPTEEGITMRSFKDSFLTTGRLDAEYYQPKYAETVAQIRSRPHERLTTIVHIAKSIEPGSDEYYEEGVPFIRVANLFKTGLTPADVFLHPLYAKELVHLYPKKDTVLFSKDGSIGIAYKVNEDMEAITSGAILHLTVKDKETLLPDYLALVLNSRLVQLQAERDAGGSIIQHWRMSEIAEVLVPMVDIDIQRELAALVQESFKLKAESQRLLATAKRAVEVAIEEGEAAATAFLHQSNAA